MQKDILRIVCLVIFSTCWLVSYSEELKYQDYVYKNNIKSVQFYNLSNELAPPIYTLGSPEDLILMFDDLEGGAKNYYYTIEHCTFDWKSSRLSSIDYLNGYSEDRIADYENSFNTIQKYTHYTLRLPNNYVKPLISGNYILKVYENNDPNDLVLTRRFYVINPKVSVLGEVVRSTMINDRDRNQKINFKVQHPSLYINNPVNEVKAVVLQNERPDNAQILTKPLFIRSNELVYEDVDGAVFDGGSEFRNFDIRSTRFFSQYIKNIVKEQNKTDVYLFDSPSRAGQAYTFEADINGNYLIRNQEGTKPETDADYLNVHFSFPSAFNEMGDYYVIGKFNDYQIRPENRMEYDESHKTYYSTFLLKQGIYNYTYAFLPYSSQKVDNTQAEGSHFETDNNYSIYIYYRKPGSRYDELVGLGKISSMKYFGR